MVLVQNVHCADSSISFLDFMSWMGWRRGVRGFLGVDIFFVGMDDSPTCEFLDHLAGEE